MRKLNSNGAGAKLIAANVRAEIARRGEHPLVLGEVLGIKGRASLYRRVNGDMAYTTDELALIADYLGLPVSALWYDVDPIFRDLEEAGQGPRREG